MVMLLQILAAVLLLVGSGLIFCALLALERGPRPVERQPTVARDHELPRAA